LNGRDFDLVVLGEINPDIIVTAKDPNPVFGQVERVVDEIRLTIGSSAAIMACGAARLGLRTGFYGVVGNDPLGRFVLEAIADHGVDVSACDMDPVRPTGATVVLAAPHDRAMLTAMGTIDALNVDNVPASLLERAHHIHISSYFLQRAGRAKFPAFLAAARRRGITTSFDCNWDPDEKWNSGIAAMFPVTDVFLPNTVEARRLTGLDDDMAAAHELVRRGGVRRTPQTSRIDGRGLVVAIKQGSEGALAVAGDQALHRSALPVRVVETSGAGDSFDAGFLAAWLDGGSLDDALALGIACGSLSTEQIGGTAGQPTLDEARAALAAGHL
jgi:sugar/nucleoside kinase (ribokinase family)